MRALPPPWCRGDVPEHLSSSLHSGSWFSANLRNITWPDDEAFMPLCCPCRRCVCSSSMNIWQLRRSKHETECGIREAAAPVAPLAPLHTYSSVRRWKAQRDSGRSASCWVLTHSEGLFPLSVSYLLLEWSQLNQELGSDCISLNAAWEPEKKGWHIEMDWGLSRPRSRLKQEKHNWTNLVLTDLEGISLRILEGRNSAL